MVTALVYSERYLEHSPSIRHPERPERLIHIVKGLKDAGLWENQKTKIIEPRPASIEDILLAHTRGYVERVEGYCRSGIPIDGDTPVQKNTFEIALLAAGGTILAGEAVVKGAVKNSFALVRPPGHHAFRSSGGGFCYFNNIAIMIRRMQKSHGVRRVAVVDYDAHHGNGTQDIFYEDPSVLHISLHQHPLTLYPGSGFTDETGSGDGEGYNINIPMKPGSGAAEYAAAFTEIILPVIDQFKPDLIAVSAGFDSHSADPLTELDLSSESYGWMTHLILEAAERNCGGKVAVVLEGGYDLNAISESAENVVLALTGKEFFAPDVRARPEVVGELKKILSAWWKV